MSFELWALSFELKQVRATERLLLQCVAAPATAPFARDLPHRVAAWTPPLRIADAESIGIQTGVCT